MTSTTTLYIPPEGLRFRIVGHDSQNAIYMRYSPDPNVGHYAIANGVEDDQWFTLLYGSGSYAGKYAIKGQVTGNVLFSRSESPNVGQIGGDGAYDDNWFEIAQYSDEYTGYFRLITLGDRILYSRTTKDPTFSNYVGPFYTDQLFYFMWEDMQVDKIEYDLDAGQIITSTPITIAEQTLTNDTDTDQEMSFAVDTNVTNSSSFEYSTGFTVTVGMEFSVGIPIVDEGTFSVDTSTTNTWTWGSTTSYSTDYTETFPVTASPNTTVLASALVDQGTLNVPYTMYMSSKSTGVSVTTTGTWTGVSSWDLRYTLTETEN